MTQTHKSMQEFWQESYLSSGNDMYLDELYENYLNDNNSVSAEWKTYFESLAVKSPHVAEVSARSVQVYFENAARHKNLQSSTPSVDVEHERQQEKIIDMINAYRTFGHEQAKLDPLNLYKGVQNDALNLEFYGFGAADLDKQFDMSTLMGGKSTFAPLKHIFDALQRIYSHSIGIEYMHLSEPEELSWIQQRMEQVWPQYTPTQSEKCRILDRLIVADGLEKYLGFKYVGQKRFSLEGGDSLIPFLDVVINRGAECGAKEVVIGMAHRGRLNVLVNVLGKESAQIFAGFEGKNISEKSSGDVKYHLGFSSNLKTPYGPIHVALSFNPSHLEIVAPVVQGSVRARQRRRRDTQMQMVVPIQIHGDAAFVGQGVVAETFNMSQARWFTVGGSIHVVINNQVGFTTSNPKDARSSLYCTAIAKMVQAPVLHVNGDDPEAMYFAGLFAIDFRNRFKKDIVIDIVCYRRHGHNEADEPSATQPLMYKVIKSLEPTYALYSAKLLAEGTIDADKTKQLSDAYRVALDAGKSVVETMADPSIYEYSVAWEPYKDIAWDAKTSTAMPMQTLLDVAKKLDIIPDNFALQAQVKKLLETRQKMTAGEAALNWGYAELLAYGSLLNDGHPIRLCGQDSGRGTFSHRHAVLHDQNDDSIYIPLSHISENQSQINIIDSLLSEEAVLAFEYGYAASNPNCLVIWEAQFGDFANGAQVVIDQFISSGEQKWGRLCGLIMYLPHGYEGQGPEHSSARPERYLQLCAQHNMQVCVPTTPAQMFHLIRRQMLRPFRKPLVVMTPKSLLRHPLATSSLADCANGEFQLVIPEIDELNPKDINRVVMCSGKVYYDLLDKRRKENLNNIAIIRIEQLYPFPVDKFKAVLNNFQHVVEFVWCQEEPKNQGAWFATQQHLIEHLTDTQKLQFAGRPESASPAVGYASVHAKEQEKLVTDALLHPFK